jgi:hypothetical protein
VSDLLCVIGAHVFDEAARRFGRNIEIPFHDPQRIAGASKSHFTTSNGSSDSNTTSQPYEMVEPSQIHSYNSLYEPT